MAIAPAVAGNVTQHPDPETLRRFEEERDAAKRDKQQAEDKIQQGESQVRRGQAKQKQALDSLDAELCRMGALPPSECP